MSAQETLLHRSFVLKELIESEAEYVRRLRIVTEDYLDPILAGGPELPVGLRSDAHAIFSTIRNIFVFHQDVFLPCMEACHSDPDALMRCFLAHSDDFNMYLPYCKNKPTSDAVRLEYEGYFRAQQSALGQRLNLEDLLIAPVQRFTKYQLLIRDLLKDTKKAGLETASMQQALALMQHIPKETNDIICMSLLRGIPRARILSHGSLWRQEGLLFWEQRGGKSESRQVFLFDHRILLASPPDRDGFFDYQTSIRTLNGSVGEEEGKPLKFTFSTADHLHYHFQASNAKSKTEWVASLRSIFSSQSKMMKALVFGKPVTPKVPVRVKSVALSWSSSDSSVDSLPSSDSDEEEADWPRNTGLQSLKAHQRTPSSSEAQQPRGRSLTLTLPLPHSSTCPSFSEVDGKVSRTVSATLSPRVLVRWFSRRGSARRERTSVPFPLSSSSSSFFSFTHGLRSPGAVRVPPRVSPEPREKVYVGKEHQPSTSDGTHLVLPGQVCVPVERGEGGVWRVKVLSGGNHGAEVDVQSNCLEEYCAPVSSRSLSQTYKMKKNDLGSGRFSRVRLGKHKGIKVYHALKVLSLGVTEEQFHRELCIGVRLQHRNLVKVLGGAEGKEPVIIMEHLVGRPLLEYLSHKSSVSETAVCQLVLQLLEGLDYLHSHTLLHLDLRPENVMVTLGREGDVVKLIDFGASRHFGLPQSSESTFRNQHTPPELFHQHDPEPGTDIWGVGVLIFVIFYGATPFEASSSMRTIANIKTVTYTFPDNSACSQEARQLMRAIFILRPGDRPSALEATLFQWFTLAQTFHQTLVNLGQLKRFIHRQ